LTIKISCLFLPFGLTIWLNYLVKAMNTETQILEAARKLFPIKGLEGTRMQEIADEAGINKALLHYYFRSKEKLFERIFEEAFQNIVPSIRDAVDESIDVVSFIRFFVPHYFNTIKKMPYLPQFIMHELAQNPSRIAGLVVGQQFPAEKLAALVQQDIRVGKIRSIKPEQLIVNLLSMVVFPFMARPVLEAVFFNQETDRFETFLEERTQEVVKSMILSLRPEI